MSKEKINLNISGMTCVNCSNGIQRVVNKLDGLESSKVNFASNSGEFVINTDKLNKSTLVQKIKKLGYGVEEDIKALEEQKKKSYLKLRKTFILSVVLTACMFGFMFFPIGKYNLYLIFLLASIVQLYAGSRFYILGFKALKNGNFDMNVLVALGTSAAYFYSVAVVLFPSIFPEHLRFVYFDGASVIITFILLGRLLEERSKAKATDFLKNLMDLAPLNANLIEENGEIKTVLASELNIDDIVLIKQGEKVSTDAIIIEGEAEIDTSMITGEPMPVYKTIGDDVIAGTLNKTGTLKVKVLKRSSDTALSNIIALLNEAGSKKMPIARLADKIANIFVPTVITLSIITFLVWFFAVGNSLSAILASISVLIISCPCALGLATPIAIVSAVGKGAKEGILIKNPEILEIIKDIKYAVFDKTGTLTEGKITVKDMIIAKEFQSLLASAELHSEHPISKAIVNFAKENQIAIDKEVQKLQILPGLGIKALYEGKSIFIGNLTLLQNNNVAISQDILEQYEKILEQGNGVVMASFKGECLGLIVLEDSIKEDATKMIQELKREHIIPVLLTGDNEITAKNVAKKIGIDLVYAGVLPDEKYKVITELQQNAKVLFVGDGINDSISIKQADIGIALNSGSDITKDAGDIILINNELSAVTKSIHLSKKAMTTIKQNLFWAFFYNAIGIPLAAGVLYPIIGVMLHPMYAGIAMSFSSVTVVLNSLRLKFSRL
jgi:Cu+-exporting ATPase